MITFRDYDKRIVTFEFDRNLGLFRFVIWLEIIGRGLEGREIQQKFKFEFQGFHVFLFVNLDSFP